MNNIRLLATAAMGLEAIVAKELRDLGYEVEVENGKVLFNASPAAIPRCNLWLRSADRLKVVVGEFKSTSFDELFEKTKALPWEQFIDEDGAFPVSGKSHKSKLYSVSDCQAIVKKAMVDRLKNKHGIANRLVETGARTKIEVAILKDHVTITMDSSGEGLHRRGYRIGQGEAPLKETLAASLLLLTNWRPDEPLMDPFCGSGTIPIEAAMIGQNIAPGFNRDFDADQWSWISQKYWDQAFEEAEDMANYDQPLLISGTDIDHKMVEISKQNAMESGFADLILWKQMQVSDVTIKDEVNGYIVSNPPYGERIGDKDIVAKAYQELGTIMREHPSWSVYILTAMKSFERHYGSQATKKRKLFNGFIETDYYQYFGK